MLSTDVRKRLEFIADRIRNHAEVSLTDMTWATKWAEHNRSAAAIMRRARREAIQGKPAEGSMDELMQGLDIGFADPTDHLQGPQDPDVLAEWFMRRPDEGRPD